ncbi:MAG TPA: BON domain-containing protein [Verrucomicrobiae bacterium]|nr:BON domain-containing protein [Verrucomicrobiae bacterium]
MKRNATIVASILFAASGAATQAADGTGASSSGYDTRSSDIAVSRGIESPSRDARGVLIAPSDPSTASQYDPASASGAFGGTVSGSSSPSFDKNTRSSVRDFHADSSIRGGSNEARGVDRLQNEAEGEAHPMNPAIQADSSIRGGSAAARQRDWNKDAEPSSGSSGNHIKADSSIRGGSPQARQSSVGSGSATGAETSSPNAAGGSSPSIYGSSSDRGDFGQSSSASYSSDKTNGSVLGSANWNPSDDLLQDGPDSPGALNSDASVGGAATSESGQASSSQPLDGLSDSHSAGTFGEDQKDQNDSSSSSAGLNSSPKLESNISGEYNLDDQMDSTTGSASSGASAGSAASVAPEPASPAISSDDLQNTDAVGGPGSTETGRSSSTDASGGLESSSAPESQVGVSSDSPRWLFRNNRAQGVGSGATGDFGIATSDSANLNGNGTQLSQRVKGTLTRESTGTLGMMRQDVARNIQVTSHGSTVTLKGTVPSQKDKDMIEIRAREVQGVNKVDNQLSISPQADPAARNLGAGHDLEDATDQLQD